MYIAGTTGKREEKAGEEREESMVGGKGRGKAGGERWKDGARKAGWEIEWDGERGEVEGNGRKAGWEVERERGIEGGREGGRGEVEGWREESRVGCREGEKEEGRWGTPFSLQKCPAGRGWA